MTWPRVGGLRSIEFGSPGRMRDELNRLVLAGEKRATAGLVSEYEQEGEAPEHVGECLAVLDNARQQIATIEVTQVDVMRFVDVPWSFAEAEGEGDADREEWRAGHRRYWAEAGTPVEGETPVVCLQFRLVEPAP